MAQCQTEINGQPILTGCPADTELFLVMNSTALGNNGGYGLRYVKDVRQCWLNSLVPVFSQYKIGSFGSMNPGDTQLVITQTNVIQKSIFITLGGPELPQGDNTQVSYTVSYTSGGFTITFDQAVSNGQYYILHYIYYN